jgi:ATP-dependent helicase/nuclease subunit A
MKDAELYEDYSQRMYAPKLVKKPAFLEKNRKLTGAEIGTAVHAVMQKLDYKKELSEEQIKVQMDDMVRKELITPEQRACVDVHKIINFFNSNIGKRMLNAEKVYREIPFHIQLKAIEVYNESPKEKYHNEYIMLQGIIDCYFEEEDGVVLVDYKTDYIRDGELENAKEKYKVQLEYYKRAIEGDNRKES